MRNKTNQSYVSVVLQCGITLFLINSTALCQSPLIQIPPVSQAIPQGGNAYLSVAVSGALPITYTWHKNFDFFTPYYEATLDSTNCTLVLTNLQPADACFFSLDTHNSYGYGPGKQVVVGVIASGMATNGFSLTVYGPTNCFWTVNCTTNIASPNWFTLTNFSISAGPPMFTFVDLKATNLSRFYQVIPTVY